MGSSGGVCIERPVRVGANSQGTQAFQFQGSPGFVGTMTLRSGVPSQRQRVGPLIPRQVSNGDQGLPHVRIAVLDSAGSNSGQVIASCWSCDHFCSRVSSSYASRPLIRRRAMARSSPPVLDTAS